MVLDGFESVPDELADVVKSRNVVVWERRAHGYGSRALQDENVVRFKVIGFLLHVKSEILNNRYWT